MKVLLKSTQTRLYYGGQNVWVSEVAQAIDFRVLQTAGRLVKEKRMQEVDVVLKYDEPQCELAVNPAYCI
jgi:hypothetical protein